MLFYSPKIYFRYLPNALILALNVLCNLAMWLWILIEINPKNEFLFLHYNILFGVDYVDVWWKIYYMPARGLFILIINLLLSWIVFSRDKFLSLLLNFMALLCQIFLFVAVMLLIFMNV